MKKSEKKRERKKETEKRRKIMVASVFAVIIIAAFFVFNISRQNTAHNKTSQQKEGRVFTDGRQTITLYNDGGFSARLFHSNSKDGTYTETTDGNVTIIIFSCDGTFANARVENNILTIPDEWDDHHGHNNKLTLR